MADFTDALNHVLGIEKVVLTDDPDDRGGQTYAGISRRNWPNWVGWQAIDRGDEPSRRMLCDFYRDNFWFPVHGDQITNQRIANSIFSFAINAGTKPAIQLAQTAVSVTADGIIGRMSLFALNSIDPQLFLSKYALAKIGRYRDICTRDRTQMKFMLGWINRTLNEAV